MITEVISPWLPDFPGDPMGATPSEVRLDLSPRLEAAAAAVRDAKEALQLKLEQRDQLIVQAVDEGMQQRVVARLAGVSQTRVIAVLAGSQPDVAESA